MRILYDPATNPPKHSCKKELGLDSTGRVEIKAYPRAGMIIQCSCKKTTLKTLDHGYAYTWGTRPITWGERRSLKKMIAP